MLTLGSKEVRPKEFLKKQSGRNCEAMHNIGLFLSGLGANIKMLEQTFLKVELTSKSSRVLDVDALKKLKGWLEEASVSAAFLDAQQSLSRSDSDIDEHVEKLWGLIGRLDEFRPVMHQLMDLGARLTGMFQLLIGNAVYQNRSGWVAGLKNQGNHSKATPEGRVLEKFLKDPLSNDNACKLLAKGLKEQIDRLKKYNPKKINRYGDDEGSDEESTSSKSSSDDTGSSKDSDSGESRRVRGKKKAKASKKKQHKSHKKHAKKRRVSSSSNSDSESKGPEKKKQKKNDVVRQDAQPDEPSEGNNKGKPNKKKPSKSSRPEVAKVEQKQAARTASKHVVFQDSDEEGKSSVPAADDESAWWWDPEAECYMYQSLKDGQWKHQA